MALVANGWAFWVTLFTTESAALTLGKLFVLSGTFRALGKTIRSVEVLSSQTGITLCTKV